MTWQEYFADHIGNFLCQLVAMAALSAFLLATGTAPGALIIILITWFGSASVYHVTAFLKLKTHISELENIMANLDKKYLFLECVPKPQGVYERYIFELLKQSSRDMVGTVSQAEASQREYREYVESWVHEIKTPITASQLICRNADINTRRKLLPELAQIENHVERALYYARAESPDRDFVIRKVHLEDIVSRALDQHRALLMQNGMCVEMEGLDCIVYTDEKWAAFLLGQLFQNAIRYRCEERGNPKIEISARTLGNQVQLSVNDNGIGIPEQEISRIFDRGFTGTNGRRLGGATGMGLYLCRRLGRFLQINLSVSSVMPSTSGKGGTSVVLTFPAQQNLSKL